MTAAHAHIAISLPEQIFQLQAEQLIHDQGFHTDVMAMPIAGRMKHMTLHDAKYVGYFLEAREAGDQARFDAVLTDAFIIALATANSLDQNLSAALAPQQQTGDLVALGRALGTAGNSDGARLGEFISAYARATGRMAKACESWDHMEDLPYVEIMRAANLALFEQIVAEAARRSLDLEVAFRARLRAVEARVVSQRHLVGRR